MDEAIELELKQLREDFNKLVQIVLRLSGGSRAYRLATLALIANRPHSEKFEADLRDELARVEAGIVHECESDEHMDGMQEAQNLIMLALSEAKTH